MKQLLLTLFISLSIQNLDVLLAQTGNIEKGRIFTSDGQTTIFKNLTSKDNSYRFQTSPSSSFQEIANDNIVKIEKQTGTEAGKWALWCGLGGLIGSSLGVIQGQAQVNEIDGSNINGGPIIIGITAVSVLTGYIIGYSKKTYSTVYTNPNLIKGTGNLESHISLDLALATNSAGVKLNYQF